jgi:hypothetical protein
MRLFSFILPPRSGWQPGDTIAAGAIGLTLCLSLAGRDLWPLTRYPMFSGYRDPSSVRVVCLALETRDGSLEWWRPRFYRYPDKLGRKLAGANTELTLWCVGEALRLIRLEEGDALRYRAIHIVERRWVNAASKDRTITRIPIPGRPGAR